MDIVYADWLFNYLSLTPLAGGQAGLQVIQVGDKDLENYRKGHIPGAIYLDTNTIEHAPDWNVIPSDQLEQALRSYGISSAQPVVLYGSDRLAVARIAQVLLFAGVQDVRILWGGSLAWSSRGYPLEAGANPPVPVAAFGGKTPAHPEYIIGIEQVRLLLVDPQAVVGCVRSWEEYIGLISGYDYIQPKGRIPGSVWAPLPGDEAYRDQHSLTPAATERLCQEIVAIWHEHGLTPDKKIAFYCGTGWRACEAFLYAHWLGWKNITVYDGGWLEWSAQGDNPIAMGAPGL
jgi:3-mercaptopyruvate sulfurtransferase SseA